MYIHTWMIFVYVWSCMGACSMYVCVSTSLWEFLRPRVCARVWDVSGAVVVMWCLQPVIEYVGDVIRNCVSDKREALYEKLGGGGDGACYMFRLDDHYVVDATKAGNVSRFINHSCEARKQHHLRRNTLNTFQTGCMYTGLQMSLHLSEHSFGNASLASCGREGRCICSVYVSADPCSFYLCMFFQFLVE